MALELLPSDSSFADTPSHHNQNAGYLASRVNSGAPALKCHIRPIVCHSSVSHLLLLGCLLCSCHCSGHSFLVIRIINQLVLPMFVNNHPTEVKMIGKMNNLLAALKQFDAFLNSPFTCSSKDTKEKSLLVVQVVRSRVVPSNAVLLEAIFPNVELLLASLKWYCFSFCFQQKVTSAARQ